MIFSSFTVLEFTALEQINDVILVMDIFILVPVVSSLKKYNEVDINQESTNDVDTDYTTNTPKIDDEDIQEWCSSRSFLCLLTRSSSFVDASA